MQTSIFSVDVEDWFHILDDPSVPIIEQWARLPSHVEKNFSRLLEHLQRKECSGHLFLSGLGGGALSASGEGGRGPRT